MRLLLTCLLGLGLLTPANESSGPPGLDMLVEWADGKQTQAPAGTLKIGELGGSGPVSVLFLGGERKSSELAPKDRAVLTLVGGDQLAGRVAGGDGETLMLRLAGFRLPVVIDQLQALGWPDRVPPTATTKLEAPEEGDRLYVLRGSALDVVDGAVVAFTEKGIEFESVLGEKLFEWNELAGLFLEVFEEENPETNSGESDETPVVCDLVGGTRLRGAYRGLSEDGLELVLAGDLRVVVPLEELMEFALDDGTVRYLSEFDVVREPKVGSPFDDGGMTWPHRRDRSSEGTPLLVAGQTYSRGLGVHAPSELVYSLGGGVGKLFGAVGIDDSVLSGPKFAHGSVRFRILGDGRELWTSDVVRGGDPPTAIGPVDVKGVDELVLAVDHLEDFMGDRANWLRLRLIR